MRYDDASDCIPPCCAVLRAFQSENTERVERRRTQRVSVVAYCSPYAVRRRERQQTQPVCACLPHTFANFQRGSPSFAFPSGSLHEARTAARGRRPSPRASSVSLMLPAKRMCCAAIGEQLIFSDWNDGWAVFVLEWNAVV